MRAPLLLILLLHCTAVSAQGTIQPAGKNCNLASPPASAGEEMNHGITLKIYPRARDIDHSYTGCQIMWIPQEDKWHILSVVEIRSGDPVRIWSPDKSEPARFSCIYRRGKVVKGDANICAAPEFLIVKSVAPGCVEKISQAVAKGGPGTAWPTECQYE